MAALLSPEAPLAMPPAAPRGALDIRHLIIDDAGPHPSAANGVHHVVRRIVREQIAAGDDARIVFLRGPERDGELEAIDLPTLILPLDGPSIAGRVVGLVEDMVAAMTAGARADTVFHVHTARHPLLPALARALNRRRLPFAVTVHGRYSHVFDTGGRVAAWRTALYLRLVERHVLEGARFVQAVSPAEAGIIARLAPRARTRVVPNAAYSSLLDGIPPKPTRPAARAGAPVFGFCGRYEILHKGLDILLEGFAAHRKAGGGGRLVLVGTGPARDILAAMAATLGVAEAVEIGGPCFEDEKRRKIAEWDFFVQPSRFDGVPIGALEAALSGLPLIVSQETGLAGHVGDANAGFVMRDLTAAAVAETFRQAAELPGYGWEELAAAAHGMAIRIGDWTLAADQLRGLYRGPPR